MNTLTREKRQIIQVSLTEGSMKILESFTKKYGTSKSIVIDRALTFLAAQYHKKIYMTYVIVDDDTTTTTTKPKTVYEETKDRDEERINQILKDQEISDEELDNFIKESEKRRKTNYPHLFK